MAWFYLLLFQEPATTMRLACIGFIVCGILGLRLAS
jgi:multidrug transporter EmrE-like cation transporter